MLDQRLKELAKSDIYPFHMPGHKRVPLDHMNPYSIDITEIDGFDNLHEARELLLEAQKQAAALYGAKESFYLVNGTTCGILSAISAAVGMQGKIIVARNCHKSVYNAIFLRELDAVYAYPQITELGIQGQITVETIEELIQENPDAQAVLITSPTYDGIVSNVEAIAQMTHKYDIPLIVDAAHGAHLGFAEGFPENPIKLGADIVIESVHKTLPAFTQTALLHICSNRVSSKKIKKYLSIYETSSPSYILMAGIERCMQYLADRGMQDMKSLRQNLDEFYNSVSTLKNLKVMRKEDISAREAYDFDESKILIFSTRQEVSGNDIHQILLEKYHLQMEMVSGQYVLALCSVMDSKEGFHRLAKALKEIDRSSLFSETGSSVCVQKNIYRKQKNVHPIYKVEELEKAEVSFSDGIGKIAGEYVYLYPPGIPVIVPGEEITEETIQDIQDCQNAGLTVEGLPSKNGIWIVNFS